MDQHLFNIYLTEQQQKAADAFQEMASLAVTNAGADAAINAAKEASEKMKATLDALIQMVEQNVQDVMVNGAGALYDMLGIDESVVTFVKNVVNMGLHATDIAGAAVLRGMAVVNSFDVHALPMSAAAMTLGAIRSITDMYIDAILKEYGVYIDLIIEFIVDPGGAWETLRDQLVEQMLNLAIELAMQQLEEYLGISYYEIRYYITQGKNLYKQFMAAKKAAKEMKNRKQGYEVDVDIDVSLDPKVMEARFNEWLKQMNDSIYNGFFVFQILDLITELKEVFSQATDVSLESLASGIETLEDVIDMLEEIGLGDDSTAIDLSMIPALGINAIYASFNNLQSMAKDALVDTASAALAAGLAATDITGGMAIRKTYDIKTDKNTKTITVDYYNDPTKNSISKKVYNTFSKAKDQNGDKIFSLSDCKILQETVNKLWVDYQNGGPSEAEMTAGQYLIVLSLHVEPEEEKKSKSEEEASERPVPIEDTQTEDFELVLPVRDSVRISADKIDDREKKRNTIKLLHTLYSILKSFIGPFKLYITLVNNYKINKAYVRANHDQNLFVLMQEALAKLGLEKRMPKSSVDSDGNPVKNDIYTIRTIPMRNYVTRTLGIKFSDTMSGTLTYDQKEQMNRWIDENDPQSRKVDMESNTTLFLDAESIRTQQECIDSKYNEYGQVASMDAIENIFSKKCEKPNGTFDGIDNIEQVGDMFVYSDSTLPRLPSQLMSAKSKGYPID